MELNQNPVAGQLAGQTAETFNRLNGVDVVPADKIGFAGMTAETFIKLLVTELQHQDPMAPVGNEQIINQLSAMQSLQSNVELRDVIQSMSETLSSQPTSQQLSTASTFIGRSITGANSLTGIVDRAFLRNGEAFVGAGNLEFSLDEIGSINTADSLVGRLVTGRTAAGETVIGIVEAVARNDGADFLDIGGAAVPLTEVTSVNTADSLVGKMVNIQTSDRKILAEVQQVIQGTGDPVIVVRGEKFALSDIKSIVMGTTVVP